MKRLMILGLLFVAAVTLAQTTRRREAVVPTDAMSVDSIVTALYGSVSHGADASPDFDRLRGIFLYVGMIVPPKKAGEDFKVTDVDGFADRYQKAIAARKEKGETEGFFEREIARKTECFGNICQIFSTYESRHVSDAKPFERGINAIQLLKDGKRWWIASVIWDAERPDSPIPAEYLPAR